MPFDRNHLPDPISYFESEGLKLTGPGKWKTTACNFHGGSDSMRINTASGGWCCLSWGAKSGGVLAYHMQAHGLEFVDAAKALGAWVDDGRPAVQHKPAPLPPRAALQVIGFEANFTAIAAANLARGVALSQIDLSRLMTAANRITRLVEVYK
ncbi:MAG: hypothetical protein H7293_14380 [Candidatus Saccharibacteria bacterium]|nr:hypothetical protein [Rhodoferax sp.]